MQGVRVREPGHAHLHGENLMPDVGFMDMADKKRMSRLSSTFLQNAGAYAPRTAWLPAKPASGAGASPSATDATPAARPRWPSIAPEEWPAPRLRPPHPAAHAQMSARRRAGRMCSQARPCADRPLPPHTQGIYVQIRGHLVDKHARILGKMRHAKPPPQPNTAMTGSVMAGFSALPGRGRGRAGRTAFLPRSSTGPR